MPLPRRTPNLLRGPVSQKTRAALYVRDMLNSASAHPLPELSPDQQALARLFGGRIIEHTTREQLRDGVTQNITDIMDIFQDAQDESEPKKRRRTSRLALSQPSINAGIPSTEVELYDLGSISSVAPVVTFHSPPLSELPTDQPLVWNPAFTIKGDKLLARIGPQDTRARPFTELAPNQQQLAFIVSSDVVEAMRHSQHYGELAIH